MNVSACLVTRGDLDMQPILDSLPAEWQKIVWDNGARRITVTYTDPDLDDETHVLPGEDLSVYGRYAAIEYATHDLIYVQDDDVIVSDPEAIVDAYRRVAEGTWTIRDGPMDNAVACNMPSEFRHDFYREHALVGFGAAFQRDAPQRAFDRFFPYGSMKPRDFGDTIVAMERAMADGEDEFDLVADSTFHRCCDVVFTALTPRVLVDVPKTNLPYADGPDRMYRQPQHVNERKRMLELALKVRGA